MKTDSDKTGKVHLQSRDAGSIQEKSTRYDSSLGSLDWSVVQQMLSYTWFTSSFSEVQQYDVMFQMKNPWTRLS